MNRRLGGPPRRGSYLAVLRYLEPLKGVGPRDLRTIGRNCTNLRVPSGYTLVHEGERARLFYVVVSGHACATTAAGASRALGVGDCFGLEALVGPGRELETVMTETDMELIVFERGEFYLALRIVPGFARNLVQILGRRIATAEPNGSPSIAERPALRAVAAAP